MNVESVIIYFYLGVWGLGTSSGILGQICGFVLSFLNNRQLRVVLDGKSSQEYDINAGVPEGSILGLTTAICMLMTFQVMLCVILLSMLMIPFSTLSVISHLNCSSN